MKKPTAAATKQFARQVRWQQRAQQQASSSPEPSPGSTRSNLGHKPSNLGKSHSSNSTLLTAIHKQQKADKYIDRILRKQGGRLHKVRPVLAAAPGVSHDGRPPLGRQRISQGVTSGVVAEIGSLSWQQPVEEDDYESEQDHYFSDDDTNM